MNEDFIREFSLLQQQVDGLIRPEKTIVTIDPFLKLPGLVGFWPMSSVDVSNGNAEDLSGQNRTLTYNGNPTYNIYNNFMPYLQLDGTGDFLSRPDEAGLRVQGNETHNAAAAQGMSTGIYVWFDNLDASQGIICKGNAAAALSSFELFVAATGALAFRISTGAAFISATSAAVITVGSWYHILCTYDPSTRMEIWVNGVSVANQTVAVPATIPNSVRPLTLGSFDGLLPMTGRLSLAHYNANLFPDALIGSLWQQTRVLFGV